MTLPTLQLNTLAELSRFNQGLSKQAASAEFAATKLEIAFHDVSSAMRDIPITIDADNVVRHSFKERMLRRDSFVLFKAVLSLTKNLADAVGILSQSGAKALSASYKILIKDHEGNAAVHQAQCELTEILMALENLEIRLRAMVRPLT
ncbi:hypothetical protein [Pseudomonas sp. PS02290]|uniref:hypothetical protein n=1 Tax=Pseudomonas sp. PS02290 TaxID=2991430 RepID=UPI00249A0DBE|nr:hypothetical protein [Pseudomonas sp. PS02290]